MKYTGQNRSLSHPHRAQKILFSKKLFILLLIVIPLLIGGCSKEDLYTVEQFKLHTLVQISTFGPLDDSLYEEIWEILDKVDNTMSMSLANSDVKKVNDAAGNHPAVVSPKTFKVVEKALSYSNISGKFDISVGPVVNLWGIGSDNPQVPNKEDLAAALGFVNYQEVKLNADDYSVFLTRAGMKIDLGAIAKGYAADEIKALLIERGVKQAIINLGGNIQTIGGKAEAKPWQIGVQNPDLSRGAYVGVMPITDRSFVTSGTYERFFVVDGKSYHHILDPQNGYPVENGLWSVSILSKESIDGDALSTLIFAEGLDRGLAIIESLEDIEAIFITKDKKIYTSAGLKDVFKVTDTTFTLMP